MAAVMRASHRAARVTAAPAAALRSLSREVQDSLIRVSSYHLFVPYPVSQDLFFGLHLLVDVLGAMCQPVIGGFNSPDMSVRSVHCVSVEV